MKFYNVISSSKDDKIKDRHKLKAFFDDKFVSCCSDSMNKIKVLKLSEKIDILSKNFDNYISQVNELKSVVDTNIEYYLHRAKNLLGSFELIEKEFKFIKSIVENIKDKKDALVFDKEIKKIDDFLNFILKSKDNLNKIIRINAIEINIVGDEEFNDLTDSEVEEDNSRNDNVSKIIALNPSAQNASLNPFEEANL